MFVYVGSYTEAPYGDGPGISGFRFDEETGRLTPVQTVDGVRNPSFLVAAKGGRNVYSTNELPEGGVSAFARDPDTGSLLALNREATHGADPCYVSIDPSGRYVLAVNYTGGYGGGGTDRRGRQLRPASDVVRHTGSSVRNDRQEAAHPHMIHAAPDGDSIVVTDLGADAVFSYGFDAAAGKLVPRPERTAKAEPGSGPRHFVFSPDGETLYVLNELTDTLTAYDWNNGAPAARQTCPPCRRITAVSHRARTCWSRRTAVRVRLEPGSRQHHRFGGRWRDRGSARRCSGADRWHNPAWLRHGPVRQMGAGGEPGCGDGGHLPPERRDGAAGRDGQCR